MSLRVHLRREDIGLYPLGECLFDGPEGAAGVLQGDHATMRLAIEAFSRGGPPDEEAAGGLRELVVSMEAHFRKEEHVLFPLMAAVLSGTEASSLARRLRFVDSGEG